MIISVVKWRLSRQAPITRYAYAYVVDSETGEIFALTQDWPVAMFAEAEAQELIEGLLEGQGQLLALQIGG